MWLTIVLRRHVLPGSNVKIRFNAPSQGFAFHQRECTTSRREFLWKNFYAARIKFSPRMLSRFCFPAGFSSGSRRRVFFLGGIPASTDFSAGFLPRYAAGIFPGKDPAGKTGHLGGIPAGSRLAPGILAGSRYPFYKGWGQEEKRTTKNSALRTGSKHQGRGWSEVSSKGKPRAELSGGFL